MEISRFRASPFSLVADPESARLWAGRPELRAQLQRLVRSWKSRPDSSLDVMWANLGCGKTHALLHLAGMLSEGAARWAVPVFVELPENIRNFRELFERVVSKLPIADVMGAVLDGAATLRLQQAARAYVSGGALEKQLVREWLGCQKPPIRDLRTVTGISARIETDGDAQAVFAELVGVMASKQWRLVLLLDEYQRLGHLQPRVRDALMSHLRGVFSAAPAHLSAVFAFGTRMESTALELVPPELRTLMGIRRPITLPEMDVYEAKAFLLERMAMYRPDGYDGPPEAPFDLLNVEQTLTFLTSKAGVRLIPRTILQTFALLYDEVETGGPMSADELNAFLETFKWDGIES